ncbi:phage portal protein [Methylobacterium sp. WL12]|uniref:phage portal protein n=1 Tax=Methylobacterium sp. WL12 TaxID=2603890 RepID=UPI0016501F59|nr:phage portal protein [Methylobacterium sp. WL12]
MGLLSRLLGIETRSGDVRLSDPFLAEHLGVGGRGANVTADAVLSNLAVAARCVALRSEMMASVGLYLFRRTDNGGRERADDNPLYGVLHDLANPNMTAFEAREFLVRSLDLTGNGYARIERNARAQVTALYPLPPLSVGVERLASGRLRYRVNTERGAPYVLLQEEMLHLRGCSRDGILGQSTIAVNRGSLGLAMTHQETASALSANSLRPSGLLSFVERLTGDQHAQVRQSMETRYSGTDKAGKLMIMDGGAKFERMSFSPEDAEFLSSRKLANEDVARVFGLPPTSVGITDKATYSNTEQEGRALVQNALGPLAGRIEAAMLRCLLTDVSRRSLYVEHDLDTLLRGDVKARFEAYRIGRETGALSPNDIRRRENDPPIPNGDIYHQPANWVPLGTKVATEALPVHEPAAAA